MTPSALQSLLPAAAPAAGERARRVSSAGDAASFASALDASVLALVQGDATAAPDAAEALLPAAETGPESTDLPTVDALATMLAATQPVLPPPGTPAAGGEGLGAGRQPAPEGLPLAPSPGVARLLPGEVPVTALQGQVASADGEALAALRPVPDGAVEADPAAATLALLRPQASAYRAQSAAASTSASASAAIGAAAAEPAVETVRQSPAATALTPAQALAAAGDPRTAGQGTPASPVPAPSPAAPAQAAPAAALPSGGETAQLQANLEGDTDAAPPRPRTASPPVSAPAGTDGAASIAAVGPAPAHTAPAAPVTIAHLSPGVGSPDWAPALAQQMVRLPNGEVELHLNPAELGPLRVKLSLADSQAQVLFVAEHAAVRQALEAALPQLRTSFAENGINLGQATVGSGAGQERAGEDGGERRGGGHAAARGEPEPAPARPAPARRAATGAVDTFA